MYKNLFTIPLMVLLTTSGYSQILNEGIVRVMSSESIFDFGSRVDAFKMWPYKIWFEDSTIIFEQRIHWRTEISYSRDSDFVQESYPVFKYSYFDIRNKIAMDYRHFSDTAMPFCKYEIKYETPIHLWKFYRLPDASDTAGMRILSDSLINGISYRRVMVPVMYPNHEIQNTVYFLRYSVPQSMFHVNPTIDRLFKNYTVTRLEAYTSSWEPIYVFEFCFEREKLDDTPRKIFKQWKQNALITSLPLISCEEAQKIPANPEKHENPKSYMVPKNKTNVIIETKRE